MTFTYDTTVPAANNDPSDDQPVMLINTQSISNLIAVDHITFNASNGGQHKAITFNQDASYVPSPPVSPPQLFTDTVAGLPQLKYYSGDAAHSSTQYVNGTNGSVLGLGGVITKWGEATSTLAATHTVTFTSAFPNNCYSVIINTNWTSLVTVTSKTTANFVVSISGTLIAPITITYQAIGN